MQQRGLRQGNCINRHASGVRFSIRYWLPLIPTLHNKLAGIARSYCAIGLRSEKWLRSFEQISPIYKWNSGRLVTVQSRKWGQTP